MKFVRWNASEVFRRGLSLEVPDYQRRYRWGDEKQWAPLSQAIRARAQARLDGGPTQPIPMGIIILDTYPPPATGRQGSEIVDGQHRLTTLQLAAAAARDSILACASGLDVSALEVLIGDELGLRFHSNIADQAIFSSVVDGTSLADQASAHHSPVSAAYLYFCGEFQSWLFAAAPAVRCTAAVALTAVIREDPRFLVIDLERNLFWRCLFTIAVDSFWPPDSRACYRSRVEGPARRN